MYSEVSMVSWRGPRADCRSLGLMRKPSGAELIDSDCSR